MNQAATSKSDTVTKYAILTITTTCSDNKSHDTDIAKAMILFRTSIPQSPQIIAIISQHSIITQKINSFPSFVFFLF